MMIKNVEINSENASEMLHILELILQLPDDKIKRKKTISDIYGFTSSFEHASSNNFGKQCTALVIRSIATHRYTAAAKLLWILCQDTSSFMPFIFKALMIVLLNLEISGKYEIIWKLICSVQSFKIMNKREIQLEYAMHVLQSDINNAQRTFKDLTNQRRKDILRKNDKIDSIFLAYSSLLDYMEFINTNYDKISSMSCQNEVSGKIALFRKLLVESGEWDIFIPKLIVMMESCDMQHDIEEILLKYIDRNPGNLNAYIYFCTFLYHTKPESEALLKYLEILCNLSPSDSRVLWMIKIWNTKGKSNTRCLKQIFMYLDYPINGKNLISWQILLKHLSIANRKKDYAKVESLWKLRSKAWEWMYFNHQKISQKDMKDDVLLPIKIACLSLLNSEHEYIIEAQKQFPAAIETAISLRKRSHDDIP